MIRFRARHNVAGLMALVLCVGLSLAALRNSDQLWATVIYTLAITTLAAAVVGAIVGEGRIRTFSTGFAVFGLTYLLIDSCRRATSTASALGRNRGQAC